MGRTIHCLAALLVVMAAASAPASAQSTSGAVLSWSVPSQVLAGDEFNYTLTVTNVTGQKLMDVEVRVTLPDGFKLTGTAPQTEAAGGALVWKVGEMEAGASQKLTVTGSATKTGAMNPCAVATCRLPQACSTITAVQPKLEMTKTGPAEVLICEPIDYTVVVRNSGDGPATNIVVTDTLPDGLVTADDKNSLTFNVGSLEPGAAKKATYTVKATKTGVFTNRAAATADRGLKAEATSQVTVRAPKLVITKAAPARVYLDREVKYQITVSNTGDGEARGTVLTDNLPAALRLVSVSEGGQASGGRVTWDLGTIAAGASKSVSLVMHAPTIGTMKNTVSATAKCTEASAEAVTDVVGIAAILLEAVDVQDPVSIGQEETYQIEVTNQGTADDKNIRIVVTLPPEEQYVSSDGPTKAAVAGQTVTFAPLASLAPKAKAVYKVVVKGIKAGDVRFKVELTSDMITTPVMETESTHIYE